MMIIRRERERAMSNMQGHHVFRIINRDTKQKQIYPQPFLPVRLTQMNESTIRPFTKREQQYSY